ncbi:MAG: hypothetical protein AAFV53_39450 [Myxococcota bacterium]
MMLVLFLVFGCHPQPPVSEWTPLINSGPAAEASRLAVSWGMSGVDAEAFLRSGGSRCPTADSVLPASACVGADPGRGQSASDPLRWSGMRASLWFERLLCPSGAAPGVTRVERAGDVVEWSVECPTLRAQQWFIQAPTDGQCDNPCPPGGLRLMAPDVRGLQSRTEDALVDRRYGDAMRYGWMAVEREPRAVALRLNLSAAQRANGELAAAHASLQAAYGLAPQVPEVAYAFARSALERSDWQDAQRAAEALIPRLPPGDGWAEEMQCIAAAAAMKADPVAACVAGVGVCCIE